MHLDTLLDRIKNVIQNIECFYTENSEIYGITDNLEDLGKGYLFVSQFPRLANELKFIDLAINKGASVVLTESPLNIKFPHIVTKNKKEAYGHICSAYYGNPSSKIKIIGVTGTNGKGTTSYLIKHIISQSKISCGLIGNIDWIVGDKIFSNGITTPNPKDLHACFESMRLFDQNVAVMEVSAHSLSEYRVNGVHFSIVVFTNLSHEHLDQFGDISTYFNAKMRLFKIVNNEAISIINCDCIFGKRIIKSINSRILTYGFNQNAMIRATNYEINNKGIKFNINVNNSFDININSFLLGRHNAQNILAAFTTALAMNIDLNVIKAAIESFKGLPGRLQKIQNSNIDSPIVYVDYAHTPDALLNVCQTIRAICGGNRFGIVFGCGGDRDSTKRPLMGRIAQKYCDFIILTSDNPRNEDPKKIIQDIIKGFDNQLIGKNEKECTIEYNREEAIKLGILNLRDKDILLIAGKGNEKYQIIGNKTFHFDDVTIASSILLEHP